MEFTGERVVEKETPDRIWLDHLARYEFAARYVKEKIVLDIACGTGYGSSRLCLSGAKKVIGVDISREAINFARNKYIVNGLEFKTGDILDISFPGIHFDLITCFETIEHVENQEEALVHLQRALKPEGILIISSPNRKLTSPGRSISNHPANAFHVKEYSTNEFVVVLNRYLDILEIYGQRPRSKILFQPHLQTVMRKIWPAIYDSGKGTPRLTKVSRFKEYRYITVVCRKSCSKGKGVTPNS